MVLNGAYHKSKLNPTLLQQKLIGRGVFDVYLNSVVIHFLYHFLLAQQLVDGIGQDLRE